MAKRKLKKFKGFHNLSAGFLVIAVSVVIKDEETAKKSNAAKEEFFALFGKYFHYFWE